MTTHYNSSAWRSFPCLIFFLVFPQSINPHINRLITSRLFTFCTFPWSAVRCVSHSGHLWSWTVAGMLLVTDNQDAFTHCIPRAEPLEWFHLGLWFHLCVLLETSGSGFDVTVFNQSTSISQTETSFCSKCKCSKCSLHIEGVTVHVKFKQEVLRGHKIHHKNLYPKLITSLSLCLVTTLTALCWGKPRIANKSPIIAC